MNRPDFDKKAMLKVGAAGFAAGIALFGPSEAPDPEVKFNPRPDGNFSGLGFDTSWEHAEKLVKLAYAQNVPPACTVRIKIRAEYFKKSEQNLADPNRPKNPDGGEKYQEGDIITAPAVNETFRFRALGAETKVTTGIDGIGYKDPAAYTGDTVEFNAPQAEYPNGIVVQWYRDANKNGHKDPLEDLAAKTIPCNGPVQPIYGLLYDPGSQPTGAPVFKPIGPEVPIIPSQTEAQTPQQSQPKPQPQPIPAPPQSRPQPAEPQQTGVGVSTETFNGLREEVRTANQNFADRLNRINTDLGQLRTDLNALSEGINSRLNDLNASSQNNTNAIQRSQEAIEVMQREVNYATNPAAGIVRFLTENPLRTVLIALLGVYFIGVARRHDKQEDARRTIAALGAAGGPALAMPPYSHRRTWFRVWEPW